jgi:hypothetical protein
MVETTIRWSGLALIARALRPGGTLVIQDFLRVQQPGEGHLRRKTA